MNAQSCQNYSTQVAATVDRLIGLHLQATDTYLSLGYYFEGNMSLEGVDHFFRDLAEEKRQGAFLLLMKYNNRNHQLFPNGQMLPSYEWHSSLDAMKTALALEKKLNQMFLDLHTLSFANADFNICCFLEIHFLKKEQKVIKKIEEYLTYLHGQASEEDNLSKYLSEKLTFN
uniref:ferritin light chain-like n=1 Tax=Jaculus jaculus TaxID=51337 RepID=UPI0003330313|nr:ferritin light chain-like [Jaculus jaculus]